MLGISYSIGVNASAGIAALNAFRGALGQLGGLAGTLAPLAGLAGGLGAAGIAVAGFKKSINEAANMETLQTSLEVMLGSARRAVAMVKEVSGLAAKSPLEMPDVAEGARMLLNFGTQADDVLPTLKMLGDVSGGSSEKFKSLALVFGQVSSAGKMTGQDLLQFINAGFNPLRQMAESTGQSMEERRKKMESGGIGVNMVRDALVSATSAGGQFFGMMEKQGQTWNGLMSSFRDNLNAVFREFGAPILPELKPILSGAIQSTDQLAVSARSMGEGFATAIHMARTAWGEGKLGELVGMSLKVGISESMAYLSDELSKVLAGFDGKSLIVSFGDGLLGVAQQFTGELKKGIAEALEAIQIKTPRVVAQHGMIPAVEWTNQPLVSGDATSQLKQSGERDKESGRAKVDSAIDGISGGVGGFMAGVLHGLNKQATTATAQIKADLQRAALEMKAASLIANIQGFADPREMRAAQPWQGYLDPREMRAAMGGGAATNAAPGLTPAIENIQPLSDRLAKIGGFIGGSGGAQGERAQLDTAKNTGLLVRYQQTLNDHFEDFMRRTQPQGVF